MRLLSIWSTYNRPWRFGEIYNFDRMHRLVLRPFAVNRTTDRANDRTITELLEGRAQIGADRATSRPKSYVGICSVTVRFYERMARPIVREYRYDQWYDQTHYILQSIYHDWWYNHERLMVRSICDQSQNRRWEVLNMFKNLAETDFASTIVQDLCDHSCAVYAIWGRLSDFWILHWLSPGHMPGVTDADRVQKPCRNRFCWHDHLRPLRPVVRYFCDLSTIRTILDRTLVVTWSQAWCDSRFT